MPEEKKELQNEDVENVSGGLSLEKAKKFAKRHEKGLKVAGAAALTAAGLTAVEEGVFKGKHRKALLSSKKPLKDPNAGMLVGGYEPEVGEDSSVETPSEHYKKLLTPEQIKMADEYGISYKQAYEEKL